MGGDLCVLDLERNCQGNRREGWTLASLLSSVSGRGEDLAKEIRDLMLEKRVLGPERLRPAGDAVDGLEDIRGTLPGPSISMSTRVRGLRFLRGLEDGRGFEVAWLR